MQIIIFPNNMWKKNSYYSFFLVLILFLFLFFSLYSSQERENFDTYLQPLIDTGSPSTNHTVNLPINTDYDCENKCSPLQRCYKTGEQCSSDIDCYGCNPYSKRKQPLIDKVVGGENEAGKLTTSFTPTFSSLTTDIGTQAKIINKKSMFEPAPAYNQGVNLWKKTFDVGMELHDIRYNPSYEQTQFIPKYPERKTLSGEFEDNGPLASNAYLS
jgi:hypothetical protein